MLRINVIIVVAMVLGTAPVEAGIFGGKKEQPITPQYVFGLVGALQNDPDEDKRQDAAESLAGCDAQAYPEIVPALINAMQRDSSAAVRREAANSLGKIRPTSLEVSQALEQTASQDDSFRVRWAARSARSGYRVENPQKPQDRVQAAQPSRKASGQGPGPAPVGSVPGLPPSPPAAVRLAPRPLPIVTMRPSPPEPTPATSRPMAGPSPFPMPKPASTIEPPPAPVLGQGRGAPEVSGGPILDPRHSGPFLARPTPSPRPANPQPEADGPILIPPR